MTQVFKKINLLLNYEIMKLELKHLAPYLPYQLKVISVTGTVFFLDTYSDMRGSGIERREIGAILNSQMKPILRPLSDLFKFIDWDNNNDPYMIGYKYGVEKVEEDGFEFYANEYDAEYCESPKCYIDITSFNWWLFEKHFDVFGLIEQGLAIDFNTIEI